MEKNIAMEHYTNKRVIKPYTYFSRVYDRRSNVKLKKEIVDLVVHYLGDNTNQKTIVDLACGTGTVAKMFGERGFRVVGIDSSPEMLRIARKKTSEVSTHVSFIEDTFDNMDLGYRKFNAAICISFSLSYVTELDKLINLFSRISRSLGDCGFFFCDMIFPGSAEEHFLQYKKPFTWDDYVMCVAFRWVDKSAGLFKVEYSFQRTSSSSGACYIEEHLCRAYSREFLENVLLQTGFKSWRFEPETEVIPLLGQEGIFHTIAYV